VRWVVFFGLMVAMPLIVVTWSRRLPPRAPRALARAFLATWISAAIAFYICVDFDSPGTWATFAFLVLPCTIVPIAAVVAAYVLGRIVAFIPAAVGAFLGWILSLLPFLIGEAFGVRTFDPDHLFAGCFLVAPSSIYAASLAVLLGSTACPRP
jgi:hypothetical protein